MIGYNIIDNPTAFAMATGIVFLVLVIGFLCVVIVLRALFRRVKAAGRVDTVKAYLVPEWVGAATGILCIGCGIVGMWVGIVPGIIQQVFFTHTYPEFDFLVFEPLGIASIVFGVLLTMLSACLFILGVLLVIEAWLKMK